MLSILNWAFTLKNFMYTAIISMTVLTILGLFLTSHAKFSAPLVKFSCIFTGRNRSDEVRLSVILTRAILFLSCTFTVSESLAVVCLAIALCDLVLYGMHRSVSFILTDFLYTVLLFNAVVIKDFLLSYTSEVVIDAKVIAVALLIIIFMVLFNGCILLRALSADLQICRAKPEEITENETKTSLAK